MKAFALAASHSKESLNLRGLLLLTKLCKFDRLESLCNYNIPIINTNKVDEDVPSDIDTLFTEMFNYDAFVFAVPEMTGLMSAGFKNLLDWFVVCTNFNSNLGQNYPFSQKPIILLTFTPSNEEAGDRHFPTTTAIINKLGGNVVYSHCFKDCWNSVLPDNADFFKEECKTINHYLSYNSETSNKWKEKYDNWNKQWNIK